LQKNGKIDSRKTPDSAKLASNPLSWQALSNP